ncbi:HIT family protein [Actinomyces sp. zg-332]|uniref:HIT family protein n=1 Tax=Actinomyces sp. zg-332 TaxID=2708340 RepID=UPI00141E2760|nr:HIT family protein [Actinomyces sp. zg-332]QPK93827.1 HIT family protein [Actinomyces sp. zg-332]
MSTIFTKIIEGQIPGNFVYNDDKSVVISTIAPVQPGHMLVIPKEEYLSYTTCDQELIGHLAKVAQIIGQAQEKTFDIQRAGIIVAGFEVPHLHIHVIPLANEKQLDLSLAKEDTPENIKLSAEKLRETLVQMGYEQFVPTNINKI